MVVGLEVGEQVVVVVARARGGGAVPRTEANVNAKQNARVRRLHDGQTR